MFAPATLKIDLPVGQSANYVVRILQTESGATKESRPESATPVRITARTASSAEVVTGPLTIRDRTVGRAKLKQVTLAGPSGTPISFFGIGLPGSPVNVGAKWRSGVYAQSPLPAGLQADCKLISRSPKGSVVDWSVHQPGATQIDGSGTLQLGTNGIVQSGKLNIKISYLRPDGPGGKIKVNSTVNLLVRITER